jgi:hypothetical protein
MPGVCGHEFQPITGPPCGAFQVRILKTRHAAGGGLRSNHPLLQLKVVLTINEAREGISYIN